MHPVGKFEQGVDQSAGIVTGGQQDGSAGGLAGEQSEGFGNRRYAGAGILRRATARGEAAPAATTHKSPAGAWAKRSRRRAATPRAARDCCNCAMAQREGGRAGYRVVGIHHQGDVPVGALRTATQGGGRTCAGEKVSAGETRGVHGSNCSGAGGGEEMSLISVVIAAILLSRWQDGRATSPDTDGQIDFQASAGSISPSQDLGYTGEPVNSRSPH